MCYVLCEERKLKIYSFYCASPFIATAGDNERKRRRERSLFEFIDPCGGQTSESIANDALCQRYKHFLVHQAGSSSSSL